MLLFSPAEITKSLGENGHRRPTNGDWDWQKGRGSPSPWLAIIAI